MMKQWQSWVLEMTVKNKKWETRKFPVKERKIPVYDTSEKLCRVVPARLASINGIGVWLLKQRKQSISLRISFELDQIYRELGELIKENDNTGRG